MHRKQVSTPSYESDTNDRPFSVWVLTILTSEACHHLGPHKPSPAFILTPIQITEWPWVSSPLSLSPDVSSHRLLISLSPHALISRLGSGQFSPVSPLLCTVDCNYPSNKKYTFSIFPASDIAAACWGDHDDPMELGWIVNNASNLFLSKEINP